MEFPNTQIPDYERKFDFYKIISDLESDNDTILIAKLLLQYVEEYNKELTENKEELLVPENGMIIRGVFDDILRRSLIYHQANMEYKVWNCVTRNLVQEVRK